MGSHGERAARSAPGPGEVLALYHTLYRLGPAEIAAAVATCFTDDARFESSAIAEPLVGHDAIADHIVAIGEALAGATVRHHTEIQWSHRTARWCWGFTGPSGSARGMDVARFADDDRIELFVVFAGLLPPPA